MFLGHCYYCSKNGHKAASCRTYKRIVQNVECYNNVIRMGTMQRNVQKPGGKNLMKCERKVDMKVKCLRSNYGKQGYSKKWIVRTTKTGINETVGNCQEATEGCHSSCTV